MEVSMFTVPIRGMKYRGQFEVDLVKNLNPLEKLLFRDDPENQADKNAIKVYAFSEVFGVYMFVGYVGREYTARIHAKKLDYLTMYGRFKGLMRFASVYPEPAMEVVGVMKDGTSGFNPNMLILDS